MALEIDLLVQTNQREGISKDSVESLPLRKPSDYSFQFQSHHLRAPPPTPTYYSRWQGRTTRDGESGDPNMKVALEGEGPREGPTVTIVSSIFCFSGWWQPGLRQYPYCRTGQEQGCWGGSLGLPGGGCQWMVGSGPDPPFPLYLYGGILS